MAREQVFHSMVAICVVSFYLYFSLSLSLDLAIYLGEGIPHEVLGPWVRWGRGQVIPDLSQRRRQPPPPPPKKERKHTLGHLDKNVQQ